MGNKFAKSRKGEKCTSSILPGHPVQPLRLTNRNINPSFSNFPRVIAQLRHDRNLSTNEERADNKEEIRCCAFSPDNEGVLVTCSAPCGPHIRPEDGLGHVRVFDIGSGFCRKKILTYHSQECDISSDGDLITFVMNAGRGEVALVKRNRNSESGVAERVDKFHPQCNGITGQTLSCKFSPDAAHIISVASLDFHSIRETNELRLWNVKSMQTVKKVVLRDVTDFCGFVTSCEFSPDGQYIAVSTSQEQLCIFRSKNLEIASILRKRCRGNMCWCVYDPRWKFEALACCLHDGRIEIWRKFDIWSNSELRYACEKECKVSSSRRLYSCQYSPDGQMLAVGTSDANVIMVNSDDLTTMYCLDGKSVPNPYRPLSQNTTVHCIAFCRSQQYVAAGYSDGFARIWSLPLRFDLKHLCRIVILHNVPASKIMALPIPSTVKRYLLNMCS